MSVDNRIEHLWNCASSLNSQTHAAKLLKSYYLNTCNKIMDRNSRADDKFTIAKMCLSCASIWTTIDYKLNLRSQCPKKQKKLQNMQANPKEHMNRKQKKRLNYLKKRANSYVEITCGFCQHKTKAQLLKPSKKTKEVEAPNAAVEEEVTNAERKKKKSKKRSAKKKNKSKIAVEKQETAKTSTIASTSLKTHMKLQGSKESIKVPEINSKKTPSVIKPTNSVSKTIKKSKKKQSNANIVALKTKSQKQQKNSLLKMAEMLKRQSQQPETTQNRLNAFLK